MTFNPIRRYVNADNSCLFSSIAYLVNKDEYTVTSSLFYRNMIVEYLLNNEYNEELLDLPKANYINEISNPSKWGGGIELNIFTKIFEIRIGVIDVETNRIDIFGEDQDYDKIIYVVYNGIHYDPLVIHDDTMEQKNDITIFQSSDITIQTIFRNYIKQFNLTGDYVNLSKLCLLTCVECKEMFHNEILATEHAKETNHWHYNQKSID
jgi:ubiquitin thioesterase OTU1